MIITSVFYDTDESKSQHQAADKMTQSTTLITNISTKNAHQTLSPIFSLLFSITLKKILKQLKNTFENAGGSPPACRGLTLHYFVIPNKLYEILHAAN